MPLIKISHITEDSRMGLWQMTETPDEMLRLYPHLHGLQMTCQSVRRRMEVLCTRALLYEMTHDATLVIGHASSGKPTLEGWHISISHTRGYAVLLLSRKENVAVDIEYRSDRVGRIASRFIRPDETARSIDDMLRIWSAKETLYKLHSEDNLQFYEMQTLTASATEMTLQNKKHGHIVTVYVVSEDDYVLTWATENDSTPRPSTSSSCKCRG